MLMVEVGCDALDRASTGLGCINGQLFGNHGILLSPPADVYILGLGLAEYKYTVIDF